MTRTLRYILLVLAAALAIIVIFASGTADAQATNWRRPQPTPPFSFQIEDENGNVLPTFRHEGQTFILGEPGERYNLRVFNPTAQRVEAVISVDGRDAVSGGIADFIRQRGYIIEPFGSVRVDGFRRSLDEVAAFRFTSPGNSYSARRGTPQNVGIIGVAFFPERQRTPIAVRRDDRWFKRDRHQPNKRSSGAPAPTPPRSAESKGRAPRREAQTSPDSSVNNLGTEYGERRFSNVVEVQFVRAASRPAKVMTLRYDDAEGLMARGIDLSWLPGFSRPRVTREPEAFPNSGRFAPPPP